MNNQGESTVAEIAQLCGLFYLYVIANVACGKTILRKARPINLILP